jgi:uncharacterized heparinase superfamily protein
MVTALLGVCHGDKGLSSWQGSGPISGDVIAQAIEATGVRTRPLKQAREWGYQRLSAGSTVLIMDAAPPPVARLVEGGCASTLAFELSDGAHRIVVNCGGSRMAAASASGRAQRGAAHHRGAFDPGDRRQQFDRDPCRRHARPRRRRGRAARHETDNSSRIEASHDGYVRRYGFSIAA